MNAEMPDQTIHKTLRNSSVVDDAPKGHRTTKCEKVISNKFVNNEWMKVDCKECLETKPPGRSTKSKKTKYKNPQRGRNFDGLITGELTC